MGYCVPSIIRLRQVAQFRTNQLYIWTNVVYNSVDKNLFKFNNKDSRKKTP